MASDNCISRERTLHHYRLASKIHRWFAKQLDEAFAFPEIERSRVCVDNGNAQCATLPTRADSLSETQNLWAKAPSLRSCKYFHERKVRCTPLRKDTVTVLRSWLKERHGAPDDPAFPNARGTELSHDGLQYVLAKHLATAGRDCPSLARKHITPHCLRHTLAMDLLQHGVGRSVIALWLGHESMETTAIYVHADLKLKELALAKTVSAGVRPARYMPEDRVLAFLKSL